MLNSQSKKILFIVQLPPPVHGASVMNNYLVNSDKVKSNFNIEIVNLQFVRSIEEITRFSLRKIYKSIYFSIEIISKILTKKPDLVYFTLSLSGYALYRDAFYVFLIKILRKKIVFHLHGKGIKSEMKKNALKKHLYRLIFKNASVICLSHSLTADIEDVCKSLPFVVPNGIQARKTIAENESVDKGQIPQILYLSNYMRDKGIIVLIETFKILKDQGYAFNGRLVGAPIDLKIEFLQNLIDDHNLSDCVQITGPLYDNAKTEELINADIFVFPTRYPNEAFPLVILEAMQFGLPVISTNEGGIPEMVLNNKTGFLIESQNPQMLVEKIAILLKDKALRIELGKQGRQRFFDNYTLDRFESEMVNTFNAILS